jgi:hypothetical protein
MRTRAAISTATMGVMRAMKQHRGRHRNAVLPRYGAVVRHASPHWSSGVTAAIGLAVMNACA